MTAGRVLLRLRASALILVGAGSNTAPEISLLQRVYNIVIATVEARN